MSTTLDHLAECHVCGCGSCKKAVEDALADFQKLTGEGCIHWCMTRVTINAVIVNLIVNDPRVAFADRQAIVERQQRLQDNFVDERTLDYIIEQIEAIDGANALKSEGGKPS